MQKYNTKQVADLLNISKSTLLRWIRQGKIQDVPNRDGRGWRVWLEEDIENVKNYHSKIYQLNIDFNQKKNSEKKNSK